MREPVHHHQPPAPSFIAPPPPAFKPRRLAEPDEKFIADLVMAIKAGARTETAAVWLGVSRKVWKRWRARSGGIFDTMRHAIGEAQAHVEVKLQSQLAQRSPGAALRELQRQKMRSDFEPEPPSRQYHQSGAHTVKRLFPHVLSRIADEAIALDDLAPLEQTARAWRESVIADLGGRENLTTAKLSLVNACLGSWLLLSTVDSYLFELASTTGVVSRQRRKAFDIVEQRMRISDSLVRQLAALGLEKTRPVLSLDQVIEQAKAANGHGSEPA